MIPRFIYELLPYLYGSTGLASITLLDTTLGRISGAMLMSAAVVIYTMRKLYRGG